MASTGCVLRFDFGPNSFGKSGSSERPASFGSEFGPTPSPSGEHGNLDLAREKSWNSAARAPPSAGFFQYTGWQDVWTTLSGGRGESRIH